MANFATFDTFVSSTYGQTIGEGECWDYINLLWSHLGSKYWTYPPSDPQATNHGVKWGWLNTDARTANTITHLTQVPSLSNIKRGDIIVTSTGTYGHAGYANENYNGSGFLMVYSQNYSTPSVTLDSLDMTNFVGAWRYDAWNVQPPSPTFSIKRKRRFPFVLYARKLDEKRRGL